MGFGIVGLSTDAGDLSIACTSEVDGGPVLPFLSRMLRQGLMQPLC